MLAFFDMHKVSQDAYILVKKFNSLNYSYGKEKVPTINVAASRDSTVAVHFSLVNIDSCKAIRVGTSLQDLPSKSVQRQVLPSAKVNEINTAEQPDKVSIMS